MDEQIRNADAKFDMEETSDELLDTWSAEEEQQRNEREYYRDRLASETGIDVLDGSDIENQFDETIAKIAFEGGLYGKEFTTTSPEFGTSGSFAKCWVKEDDGIYLLKRALFRNVFISDCQDNMQRCSRI